MSTETVQPTAVETKTDQWQAFLSHPYGFCYTDPEEIAAVVADKNAEAEISIRRGTALPTEKDGGVRLPGTCFSSDLFVEICLDDLDEPEGRAEAWELAQKAAAGMNQPAEPPGKVALTMSPDAGEVFLKALIYAANRIPPNARMEGAEMSHEDWLRWGASRLDAAIRAAVPAVPAETPEATR